MSSGLRKKLDEGMETGGLGAEWPAQFHFNANLFPCVLLNYPAILILSTTCLLPA
jgi:hypothetical protein